jgi:hypothetical protein
MGGDMAAHNSHSAAPELQATTGCSQTVNTSGHKELTEQIEHNLQWPLIGCEGMSAPSATVLHETCQAIQSSDPSSPRLQLLWLSPRWVQLNQRW